MHQTLTRAAEPRHEPDAAAVVRLDAHPVEKPWGRIALPEPFTAVPDGRRIGEIWFRAPDGRSLPLLVKYIFTSEKLSVQVHPNDAQARARGLPNGKTECWYILDAAPGATIGLGFTGPLDREAMRRAALDGSIESLMGRKPVRAGDFFCVPATTVHTIGAGIALIEVQQQSDTTYRLYDHGRARPLHLDDALSVAGRRPYPAELTSHVSPEESRTIEAGSHFRMEHVAADGPVRALIECERWVLPLAGQAEAGGETGLPGDCLLVPAGVPLSAHGRLLLAAVSRA